MTSHSNFACSDRRVARVLRYVAEDLTRRPTLTDVSRIAGLEATYFSKRFRSTVGIPYAEWSTRLRVFEARELLAIADLSITAIAAAVGYMDVTTFARAFRRVEGKCPREHRYLVERSRPGARAAELVTTSAATAVRDIAPPPPRGSQT